MKNRETAADESREHSSKFLEKAARMAKRGKKKRSGKKRGGKMRYA